MASISVVQGARDTNTLSNETRRVRDVEPELQQLEPEAGPLTQILSRLETMSATDRKIEWFEDQLLPDFDILASNLAAGDATMTVTNFKYFRAGDLVRVNDNEVVRVSATPTTTSVAITRGYGSIAAVAATAPCRLFIVSDAGMEFDTYRDQLTTQKIPKYNYIQDLSTPMSFTDHDMATETFAGKDLPNEHRKGIIEQKKKQEKSLFLGQPYLDTTGAHPVATSAGMLYYIQTNVKDVSGGFTEAEFEDFLRICFRYGSAQKMVFCSPKLIQSINGFSRSKLQTYCDDDSYGVTITEYKNAGRRVGLIEEKLLTNASLNDMSGIAGYGFLIDPANVKMAYMQGMGTQLAENLQNPGVKGRVDEVRSSYGFKMFLDQTHGLLTGVAD
jgi:hypothetical protein